MPPDEEKVAQKYNECSIYSLVSISVKQQEEKHQNIVHRSREGAANEILTKL